MKNANIQPLNSDAEMMVFNCSKCGEGEALEDTFQWNEDASATCQCGQNLVFRRAYNGKRNQIAFK